MSNPRPRKKARRAVAVCAKVAAPLPPLPSLPLAALEHLLHFLPVASLQLLGATCTFLHQLIHGRTITTLEFPFTPSFLQELAAASTIDKKPLLRLTCYEASLPHISGLYSTWAKRMQMIAQVQLPLLDLSRLRELVLEPDLTVHHTLRPSSPVFVDVLTQVLTALAGQDSLRRVTRLGVPLASILASIKLDLLYAETRGTRVLNMLAGLLELDLIVRTKAELNQLGEGGDLMAHVRPVSLGIIVMPSVMITRKTVKEVANPWVEELVLTCPCLLQFRLRMAILRRVAVKTYSLPGEEACSLLATADLQPSLHRTGSCGVDVRSLWEGCPLLTKFNGIPLEVQGVIVVGWQRDIWWLRRNQLGKSYTEWMVGTKRAFHRDYRARGGELGLQAWARTRWSPRQLKLQAGLNYRQI